MHSIFAQKHLYLTTKDITSSLNDISVLWGECRSENNPKLQLKAITIVSVDFSCCLIVFWCVVFMWRNDQRGRSTRGHRSSPQFPHFLAFTKNGLFSKIAKKHHQKFSMMKAIHPWEARTFTFQKIRVALYKPVSIVRFKLHEMLSN